MAVPLIFGYIASTDGIERIYGVMAVAAVLAVAPVLLLRKTAPPRRGIMTRPDCFFLPASSWRERFRLEGEEARHLAKVLRLGPGARVRCFDGLGREGLFTVLSVQGGVTLGLENQAVAPRPRPRTWLALGWNKSSRRGWLMEKASELGCAGIAFWEAERSQGAMPKASKESWTGQLLAGAKQSGNPWLPEVEMLPDGIDGLTRRFADFAGRILRWEAEDQGRRLDGRSFCGAADLVFVIGPEGGLTDREAGRLRQDGFAAVSLGPRPLRWETAALVSLGLACLGAGKED